MNSYKSASRFFKHALSLILLLFLISACSDDVTQGDFGKLFKSETLAQGETFSHTFQQDRIVSYFCETHPTQMQGTITVNESADISETDTVEMENIQFNPDQLTIAPNTKIVWINRDSELHTVVSGNPEDADEVVR
jgi:plastocyanin